MVLHDTAPCTHISQQVKIFTPRKPHWASFPLQWNEEPVDEPHSKSQKSQRCQNKIIHHTFKYLHWLEWRMKVPCHPAPHEDWCNYLLWQWWHMETFPGLVFPTKIFRGCGASEVLRHRSLCTVNLSIFSALHCLFSSSPAHNGLAKLAEECCWQRDLFNCMQHSRNSDTKRQPRRQHPVD